MLPESMIAEYFTSFYLKKLMVGTRMSGFRLEGNQDSLLREKSAAITLQKPYYYMQAVAELHGKALNYDTRYFLFSSPKNKQLAASIPYRRYLE